MMRVMSFADRKRIISRRYHYSDHDKLLRAARYLDAFWIELSTGKTWVDFRRAA